MKSEIRNNELLGTDFEWYAIDSAKQIGFFTTAGELYFPNVFIDKPQLIKTAWNHFKNLPKVTKYIKCKSNGLVDDWIDAAESGYYGYDFDIHDKNKSHVLICRPEKSFVYKGTNEDISLPFYPGVFGVAEIDKDETMRWELK